MAHDVFVSHAIANKAVADATVAGLEAAGVRCWIAPRDILPGTDFMSAIWSAIAGSRVLVIVLSPESNASSHVTREVQQAVERGLPVVPLRIADVDPSGSLSYALSGTHWLDARTPPLEAHLQRLTVVLEHLLATTEETPRPGVHGALPHPPDSLWTQEPVHHVGGQITDAHTNRRSATDLRGGGRTPSQGGSLYDVAWRVAKQTPFADRPLKADVKAMAADLTDLGPVSVVERVPLTLIDDVTCLVTETHLLAGTRHPGKRARNFLASFPAFYRGRPTKNVVRVVLPLQDLRGMRIRDSDVDIATAHGPVRLTSEAFALSATAGSLARFVADAGPLPPPPSSR